MSGEELAIAEASYREMKERIEAMGAVNMMALEEFNECDQRFAFLTRERDDLLQSIQDTQASHRGTGCGDQGTIRTGVPCHQQKLFGSLSHYFRRRNGGDAADRGG